MKITANFIRWAGKAGYHPSKLSSDANVLAEAFGRYEAETGSKATKGGSKKPRNTQEHTILCLMDGQIVESQIVPAGRRPRAAAQAWLDARAADALMAGQDPGSLSVVHVAAEYTLDTFFSDEASEDTSEVSDNA